MPADTADVRGFKTEVRGPGVASGRLWEHQRMLLSFAYLAFSAVLRLLVGRRRSEVAKDVECCDINLPCSDGKKSAPRSGRSTVPSSPRPPACFRSGADSPAPGGKQHSGTLPDEARGLLDPVKPCGTRAQCQSIRCDVDQTFLINAHPVGKQAELDVVNYRLSAEVIRSAIGDVSFSGLHFLFGRPPQ
jgi:hypothetical protein